jgi:hypothetical protein
MGAKPIACFSASPFTEKQQKYYLSSAKNKWE